MSWKCCQLPIFVGMYSNPSAQVSIVDLKTKSTTRRWIRNGYRPYSLIWYKTRIRFFFRTCFSSVRARGTRDKIPQMCQKIAECWECSVYVPDLCSNRLETWLSPGFGTTRSQQCYDFKRSFSKRLLQLCRVLREIFSQQTSVEFPLLVLWWRIYYEWYGHAMRLKIFLTYRILTSLHETLEIILYLISHML